MGKEKQIRITLICKKKFEMLEFCMIVLVRSFAVDSSESPLISCVCSSPRFSPMSPRIVHSGLSGLLSVLRTSPRKRPAAPVGHGMLPVRPRSGSSGILSTAKVSPRKRLGLLGTVDF
jgi:hypothetical protein